jgi:hypothetical protein
MVLGTNLDNSVVPVSRFRSLTGCVILLIHSSIKARKMRPDIPERSQRDLWAACFSTISNSMEEMSVIMFSNILHNTIMITHEFMRVSGELPGLSRRI